MKQGRHRVKRGRLQPLELKMVVGPVRRQELWGGTQFEIDSSFEPKPGMREAHAASQQQLGSKVDRAGRYSRRMTVLGCQEVAGLESWVW